MLLNYTVTIDCAESEHAQKLCNFGAWSALDGYPSLEGMLRSINYKGATFHKDIN